MRRGLEIEDVRIAHVERENSVPFSSNFVSHERQITDGVADVLDPLGSGDLTGLGNRHETILPERTEGCRKRLTGATRFENSRFLGPGSPRNDKGSNYVATPSR